MTNRYTFDTELEGFINCGEPQGKFNNSCFAFKLPQNVVNSMEEARPALLDWAKSKVPNPNRVAVNPEKWDEEGVVKVRWGPDCTQKDLVFIDTEGSVLDKPTRASIRKGTKVRMIVDHKPYTKPNIGTTVKVVGVQVIELVAGEVSDSGDLSSDDVAALFTEKVAGFKSQSPAPRQTEEVYTDF